MQTLPLMFTLSHYGSVTELIAGLFWPRSQGGRLSGSVTALILFFLFLFFTQVPYSKVATSHRTKHFNLQKQTGPAYLILLTALGDDLLT